jgi:PAS domain S-box-containing protein
MGEAFPLDVDALLSVLNYLNMGVYITDLDRRIVLWNRKAEEVTGYRAADVVGHCCRDNILCHVDKDGHLLCPTHLCPLYRSMSTGRQSLGALLVFAQKSGGGRIALSVSVAPLRDASGTVIGGVEVFSDETESLHDLEFARKIQKHLLPERLPRSEEFVFDARYYPHDLVGGDLYDVSDLGGGRYAMLVADVRGHGISASLYTTVLKSISQSIAARAADPGDFLSALNRELSRLVVSESFATAACAVVDTNSWQVIHSSAGQPPAIHYRAASKDTAILDTFGLPLGIDAGERYESSALYLMTGDLLLFYTDGITDVRAADDRMIATQGLARLVADEMSRPGPNLLERIYQYALATNADVAIADDVLLLSVERMV